MRTSYREFGRYPAMAKRFIESDLAEITLARSQWILVSY